MNRELKFRMWDGGKNKFAEFFGISFLNTEMHDVLGVKGFIKNSTGYTIENKEDKCIIQQYTGIKDVNGRDIYEGDILLYNLSYEEMMTSGGENELTYVLFKDGAFFLSNNLPLYDLVGLGGRVEEEVVGNICENPEMLEECIENE